MFCRVNHSIFNIAKTHNVFTTVFNQFTQSRRSGVSTSSKGILNYRIFKEDLKLDKYLLKLSSKKYKLLCRFRCFNLTAFPFGCINNIANVGKLTASQSNKVHVMGFFPHRDRRSHGHHVYTTTIHDVTLDSLLPYVNRKLYPHHIRTKLYSVS
jgi:hypothetical protein